MEEKNLANKTTIDKATLDEWLKLRDQIQDYLIQTVAKDKINELDQLSSKYQYVLFMIQDIMEQAQHQWGDSINIIFELGVLNELLVLSGKLYTAKKTANALNRPRTAYKDQILEILYNNGPLLHKTLAEKLKITPSNLSNVIRRLNNEEIPLIEETAIGKYKYYTLSRAGRAYIKDKSTQDLPLIMQISPKTAENTSKPRSAFPTVRSHWTQKTTDSEKWEKKQPKEPLILTYVDEDFNYNQFDKDFRSQQFNQYGKALKSTLKTAGKEKSPQAV